MKAAVLALAKYYQSQTVSANSGNSNNKQQDSLNPELSSFKDWIVDGEVFVASKFLARIISFFYSCHQIFSQIFSCCMSRVFEYDGHDDTWQAEGQPNHERQDHYLASNTAGWKEYVPRV